MILCFDIFASTLSCCTHGMPHIEFVPKVAWALDRKNSSLAHGLNFIVDDPDGMEGNKEVVSNLLSCKRPLKIRAKPLPSLAVARERFKSKVMPHISEDMVAKAVLAILYIISKDETIVAEHEESFRKYLGMHKEELLRQTSFNVPDFFARVLLYTTCIDNKEGGPYVEKITDTFIEKATKDSWSELKWDAATQTVEIIPSEERRLLDEINTLSELRHSLMAEQVSHTDTGWLDVDESVLFPSRCKSIELGDSRTKAMITNKLMQYMKLVREFTECLAEEQQSMADQTVKWPVFPDEKMRDIRQRLTTLSNELFALGIFSERLNSEQAPDSSSLKIE